MCVVERDVFRVPNLFQFDLNGSTTSITIIYCNITHLLEFNPPNLTVNYVNVHGLVYTGILRCIRFITYIDCIYT